MADRATVEAMIGESPLSIIAVKAAATGDVAVGVVGILGVILGADVPDGVLIAVGSFLAVTVTGILGWALVTLWNIGQVVARVGEQVSDHERRLGHLEGE